MRAVLKYFVCVNKFR